MQETFVFIKKLDDAVYLGRKKRKFQVTLVFIK